MLHLLLLLLLLFSNVGRSRSAVVKSLPGFSGDLPFKLETGYVGVGELQEVQLFYYFIESERSPKDDPLLLWLTGGPGCSALSGLLFEIGPLQFDYSDSSENRPVLKLNPYSWTKIANIIFLDAPVGTGFSYATAWRAYNSSDTSSATQTYEFLRKWLMSHPRFLTNPLYITGDSYSGVVVPIIVKEVYDGNEAGREPPMNLKGYVLGNPVTCEVKDISQRIPFGHKTALISDELYESTKKDCNGDYVNVDPTNGACLTDLEMVSKCLEKIYLAQILEPMCSFLSPNHTKLKWSRSILEENIINVVSMPLQSRPWCRNYNYLYSYIWANDRNVQEALHIREGTKPEWDRCNESLSYTKDVLNSVVYHRYLSKTSLRALIYSGDHDLAIPYIGTLDWIRSLNLTLLGPWAPWFVNGQVAGYSILYSENNKYDLTYTTIKGGGHTAPEYKPKECFSMVDRWFSYYPL
ncbi:serine carboxypeptidase-like 18 isoform X2 [Eucalyptus grandis]|uniref:serine carboxypeptidase-like 18 isoform X2 n=1 Tax=Eucalyptus grandis TaxID=71139 RepID=UPI00192EB7E0|nr:serine carboxypeptidase-like 18 isoform X2 [Eucalyptus grandis]